MLRMSYLEVLELAYFMDCIVPPPPPPLWSALSDVLDILGSVGMDGKLLISVRVKKNIVISLWTFTIFGTIIDIF